MDNVNIKEVEKSTFSAMKEDIVRELLARSSRKSLPVTDKIDAVFNTIAKINSVMKGAAIIDGDNTSTKDKYELFKPFEEFLLPVEVKLRNTFICKDLMATDFRNEVNPLVDVLSYQEFNALMANAAAALRYKGKLNTPNMADTVILATDPSTVTYSRGGELVELPSSDQTAIYPILTEFFSEGYYLYKIEDVLYDRFMRTVRSLSSAE